MSSEFRGVLQLLVRSKATVTDQLHKLTSLSFLFLSPSVTPQHFICLEKKDRARECVFIEREVKKKRERQKEESGSVMGISKLLHNFFL